MTKEKHFKPNKISSSFEQNSEKMKIFFKKKKKNKKLNESLKLFFLQETEIKKIKIKVHEKQVEPYNFLYCNFILIVKSLF